MHDQLDYENTFPIPERASALPSKLLVGAGPTNPSPRVILAMANSTTSANCPELYKLMDDIKSMSQHVFQTKNEVTLALQASGTGGLEAALCNIVDPGDKVIVAVNGYWGERMVEKAQIRGADLVRLESLPGEIFSLEDLEKQIIKHKPLVLVVTHGESSAGTLQNLDGLGKICHRYNCLLMVDAVVSLGGVPFFTDRWEIDVAVAGTQKAIGAPPGMALITMSPKAVDRMRNIKHRPPFYYNIVDTCQMWNILHTKRYYYITYNSHLLSAVREALFEIVEEGLLNRWQRHRVNAERFWRGINKLGMEQLVKNEKNRLVTVNAYFPPNGIRNIDLINYLVDKYKVIPGFGITASSTNALRFGFMGYNARPEVIDYTLKTLEEAIGHFKSIKNNNVETR